MAFQISKVTAHVSENLTRIRLNQLIHGFKSSRCGLHTTALNTPPNARRAINIASNSERFLTTSFSRPGEIKTVGLLKAELSRYRSIAVLFGTVVVSVATVCCTSVCAMSTKPTVDLESEKSNWKEVKNRLLSMSLQDRRARYKTDYISLDKIPVWKPSGSVSAEPLYKANEDLNQKISVFRGDITKLEIDAIANAANKTLLGGGGVDGAIHRGAGPHLRKECSTLGGCETGEAKITGAYNLPAKYVIHTVGPIAHGSVGERERRALRDCYYNCLRTATENKLRTVAFPCISTGVYGYPPEQAVEVALKTVREYLEEHHGQVDRVIFCVFLKSDEDLYMSRLPAYFPKDGSLKSKL